MLGIGHVGALDRDRAGDGTRHAARLEVVVGQLCRPTIQHPQESGVGDLRLVIGRAVDDFGARHPYRKGRLGVDLAGGAAFGLATYGTAKRIEPIGEVGREIQSRLILARSHLDVGLGSRVGRGLTLGRRLVGREMQFEQLGPARIGKQPSVKLLIFE